MNSRATSGKNLQTVFPVANTKGAYEIGAIGPSAPNLDPAVLFSSSAKQQRTPVRGQSYGGRRLRYRWVDQLKPWQVRMLHQADAVAFQLGLPLETFITVNYHATFPGGAAMASTFKKAMKRMGQWLRDNGVCFAYIYVHENPDDAKPNSHLLVHVPLRLRRAFKDKAGEWFDALDGGVQVEPRNDAKRRAKGQSTRLQYMAKGAPDPICRIYGGRRAAGGQGPITLKRSGVAQFLQPKHQKEFPLALTRVEPAFQTASSSEEFLGAITREEKQA
jgi:hypothetical protein